MLSGSWDASVGRTFHENLAVDISDWTIHVALTMNCNAAGEPLTFHLATF